MSATNLSDILSPERIMELLARPETEQLPPKEFGPKNFVASVDAAFQRCKLRLEELSGDGTLNHKERDYVYQQVEQFIDRLFRFGFGTEAENLTKQYVEIQEKYLGIPQKYMVH